MSALAVLGLLLASGCREEILPPEEVGSYVLEQLEGQALPATLADGTVVVSGTLGLDGVDGGSSAGNSYICVSNTTYTPVGGTEQTSTALCRWTASGSGISVSWDTGVLNFGPFDGSRVTLTMEATPATCPLVPSIDCAATVWVYRR